MSGLKFAVYGARRAAIRNRARAEDNLKTVRPAFASDGSARAGESIGLKEG